VDRGLHREQTSRQLGMVDGTNIEEVAKLAQKVVTTRKRNKAMKEFVKAKKGALDSESRTLAEAFEEFNNTT
jgi:hypothetical protein